MPPCPRWWVASGPPLRFRRPQCRPSAATGGPISSLVGGWPQCLPSAAQAPPYPPPTRGPQAFSGATAHSRAAAKHTYRSHLPARPCAPFFLPCLPPLPPAPTPRPVFLSCGWMAQCLISGHSGPPYPLSPRLPMSPAPCRPKAPPLGGQADDRAPLPNKAARPHRTPALFNSSHLRGRALPSTPPPLHPRFWHGNRPPWPGVVCCPHPPGAALLPWRKVLGPTLQPIDKEHASPPIYLPPPPLRGPQTTPLCLTVTVQVNMG